MDPKDAETDPEAFLASLHVTHALRQREDENREIERVHVAMQILGHHFADNTDVDSDLAQAAKAVVLRYLTGVVVVKGRGEKP